MSGMNLSQWEDAEHNMSLLLEPSSSSPVEEMELNL